MNLYNNEFYEKRHENTKYSAHTILSLVEEIVPNIKSAVDLGCGVGTWLSVLKEKGIDTICGIDGNWVNKDYLKINKNNFIEHNFSEDPKLNLEQTFDIAISLEVAEHLPHSLASQFVSSLTHLSDIVLFSAAIPGQGGIGHINEQWPDYWINLFNENGYIAIDVIRKRIWQDEAIEYWYRQNIILFVKQGKLKDLKINNMGSDHVPPEIYLIYLKKAVSPLGIKESIDSLFSALLRRMKKL